MSPFVRNRFVFATVAVAVVLAGCGSGSSSPAASSDSVARAAAFRCPAKATGVGTRRSGPRSGGRLHVVTTVAPITSIVANVAGDLADVRGVIPEGEDSHTFEPKPSVATTMAKADVVFVNGLKLEDPTKEMAQEAGSKVKVVELGTLALRPDQYLFDFSFPKDGGKPNPHLWTNPPMARCYAQIAASALAKADPAHATSFQANAKAFVAKVDDLDALMRKGSASMPARNRKLLTYHDAYAYFAAHYGWKVIGAIQVSSFEDPTPKEITSLVEQIRREKVPAIFGSEVFPSPVLAQLAKEADVKYVDKLRDDDLPGAPGQRDHSYLGLMKFDFATMVSSLGGDAGALKRFDASDTAPDRAEYPQ